MPLRLHYLCGCVALMNRINTKAVMWLLFLQLYSRYQCVTVALFFFYDSMYRFKGNHEANVAQTHKSTSLMGNNQQEWLQIQCIYTIIYIQLYIYDIGSCIMDMWLCRYN